jgi:hypothetical protein
MEPLPSSTTIPSFSHSVLNCPPNNTLYR